MFDSCLSIMSMSMDFDFHSLYVCPVVFTFHKICPFACAPVTIDAAAEGLEKDKSLVKRRKLFCLSSTKMCSGVIVHVQLTALLLS